MMKRNSLTALPFTCCLLLLLTGCNAEKVEPSGNQKETKTVVNVTIRPVNRQQYDDEIKKHQGKVVLVDFWATWCGPCKVAFPHTLHLSDQYKDAGLDVLSVSLDYPTEDNSIEKQSEKALKFLRSKDAGIVNLIANPKLEDDAYETFEITDRLIPHFKLYGRDGKLIDTYTGGGKAVEEIIESEIKIALDKK